MALVLTVDPRSPQPDLIDVAARHLREGRLVAFPTETVYGLGAHALDRRAVRQVFAVKGRPATDPLIVHVDRLEQLHALTRSLPAAVHTLATRFWPGPLTLVLPRSAAVPDDVTAGLDTVAVRIPAHPVARSLLATSGIPIAAPSANLFSRPSPTRASHVLDDLGDRIDVVIDGGPTSVGIESTVLDMTGQVPAILRPGAVTLEMLRPLLPGVRMAKVATGDEATAMASPGLLEKHYSPRAPLTLYVAEPAAMVERLIADALDHLADGQRVGILACADDAAAVDAALGGRTYVVSLGSRDAPEAIAARLYGALRELDASGVDVILARGIEARDGVAIAIADRLRRAAAGRIVTEPARPVDGSAASPRRSASERRD